MDKLFVTAIEAIYDAASDPSRWPHALQSIADCFDDVGTVMLWQRDDGSFGSIASPSLEAAQKDYAENGWNHRDLPAIRAVERGLWLRTDAVTDRHAVSDAEIATDPFYTEFMARYGLRWRAAIGVAPDPHVAVAISVQRVTRLPRYYEPLRHPKAPGLTHPQNHLVISVHATRRRSRAFKSSLAAARVSAPILT